MAQQQANKNFSSFCLMIAAIKESHHAGRYTYWQAGGDRYLHPCELAHYPDLADCFARHELVSRDVSRSLIQHVSAIGADCGAAAVCLGTVARTRAFAGRAPPR